MKTIKDLIQCQLCQKNCNGTRGLSRHVLEKHKEIDYKTYFLKYLTTETNYKCPYCVNERKFRSLTDGFSPVCENKSCLGKYVDSHRKNKNAIRKKHYGDYTCQICNKEFNTLESLQAHLFISIHPENSCHKNTITPKDYYIKYLMPKDTDIKCPICKINDRHFKSMMIGFSPTCKQRICISSYGNWFRSPTISEPKIFKNAIECKICHKFFELDKGLASHISQMQKDHPTKEEYYIKYLHPEIDPFCPFCKTYRRRFIDIQKGFTSTCCDTDCICERIFQTKVENKSFLGNGFSMFPIKNIFDPVIDQLELDKTRCKHALLNKEFIHHVGNIRQFAKRNINAISYDFAYMDFDLKTPLIVCEFNGICFHLKKEEAWKRRKELDYFKNNLFKQYIKDILKKRYIQEKYPDCKYIEIWEDDVKSGLKQFIKSFSQTT